jgi:hypothetical protein
MPGKVPVSRWDGPDPARGTAVDRGRASGDWLVRSRPAEFPDPPGEAGVDYDRRDSIEVHLLIVFASLAVSCWIEEVTS